MLCENRPDGGIGPTITLNGHTILTSCFDDVIFEPIGCWVFILGALILMAVFWRRRDGETNYIEQSQLPPERTASKSSGYFAPNTGFGGKPRLMWGGKWPKTRRFCLVMTAFLLVANFAMHVLEIARLAADNRGVGLLPFCLVPLLVVFLSLWIPAPAWARGGWKKPARPHGKAWMILVSFWALWMCIASGIKLWSFVAVKNAIGEAAYNGVDSKYPYSDRVIDTVVILCVYYSLWLFYVHEIYMEFVRYSYNHPTGAVIATPLQEGLAGSWGWQGQKP